jgi:hypothetical protein
MLSFLNEKRSSKDIKTLRSDILDFIKEQLKKAESGEGQNIKGLQLYINCDAKDKFVYESVVYLNSQDKFKEEVQKIADDFAIDLPPGWSWQVIFDEEVPEEAIRSPQLRMALFIQTKQKASIHKEVVAYMKVLNGEAEQAVYELHSSNKKINIGREKNVQAEDGYLRQNQIVFSANGNNKSNQSVSRRHAHIEWNAEQAAFFLYADEGGIPPGNKIKIKPEKGPEVRLITIEVGHHLKEGDQVILGASALLEFSYMPIND